MNDWLSPILVPKEEVKKKKNLVFLGKSTHELNKAIVNESNLPAFSPTGAVFLGL